LKLWYTIPGIMSQIDDPGRWHLRAQLWLHDRGAAAATYQYAAGVLGGTLSLDRMAEDVYGDMGFALRGGFDEVVILAHSNGGRIVSAVLDAAAYLTRPMPRIRLYAFAPACHEDCDWNHFNAAAEKGVLTHASIYSSLDDEILKIPAISYGKLGLVGPVNVAPALAPILRDIRRPCTHGEWVNEDLHTNLDEIWTLEQARGLAADSPASAPATHETPGAALPTAGEP
jgi:hypothetical protein